MATLNLAIEKMHCGSCVRRVTQTLNAVPGTRAEEVRVGGARIESTAAPDEIVKALDAAGFPAQVLAGGA